MKTKRIDSSEKLSLVDASVADHPARIIEIWFQDSPIIGLTRGERNRLEISFSPEIANYDVDLEVLRAIIDKAAASVDFAEE